MRKAPLSIFLLLFLACFQPVSGQMSPEKIQSKRYSLGKMNDSAWSYSGFWSVNYFMGEKQLGHREFMDGMSAGDQEVAALIKKFRTHRTLFYTLYVPGVITFLAGSGIRNGSIYSNRQKRETIELIGGLGMVTGAVFLISSTKQYRKAVSLFNYKARRKELEPAKVSFRLGVHRNGVGISFNW